jgi:hypothetical protein
VGVSVILGLSAIPVFANPKQRKGHDLFSQEKPEAVEQHQEQLKKEYREQERKKQQEQ